MHCEVHFYACSIVVPLVSCCGHSTFSLVTCVVTRGSADADKHRAAAVNVKSGVETGRQRRERESIISVTTKNRLVVTRSKIEALCFNTIDANVDTNFAHNHIFILAFVVHHSPQ